MIRQGMRARGHAAEVWTPAAVFRGIPGSGGVKKWLGYVDQFAVFPCQVRHRLKNTPGEALFVVADQALGPWVPLVADRPHVIHVHDFMALRSALGEFPQHSTGWTGRQYQALIRWGFGRGKHFISVSESTRADLHRFLPGSPCLSEVVPNGLNFPYRPISRRECADAFATSRVTFPRRAFCCT